MPDKKTALVLCGGGAKGAYEAGVIDVLAAKGIKFDIICGTSVGALNASFCAESMLKGQAQSMGENLVRVWSEDVDERIMALNWRILTYPLSFIPFIGKFFKTASFLSNRRLKKILKKYLTSHLTIKDYQKAVDLVVTGTDIQKAETYVFTGEANILQAVLASSAFPMAFPLIAMNNTQYTDGGIFNNKPLEDAIRRGAENIYVVMLDPPDQGISNHHTYTDLLDLIGRLVHIYFYKAFQEDIHLASSINEQIARGESPRTKSGKVCKSLNIVVVQPEEKLPISTFGFNKKRQRAAIEIGRKDAGRVLG